MGVRFFVGALLAVLLPSIAEARDCITVRQDDVAIVQDSGCGDLRLKSRTRDDARPNIDIGATWIEFATPAGPGEWRYNDWIGRQVATLNLDKPIKLVPEGRSEDRFTVESLYRSDTLISARYSRRMCCGDHGGTVYRSINVDLRRWTLFSPDDLVSLGAAANACWRQFADDRRHREAFAAAWPRERPWVDRDFEHHRIGHAMRELIGPMVVDPKPSTERTHRVFVAALRDQTRWSFSDRGASIDFGALLGSASSPFFCTLGNADLKAIVHAGVAVPP